MKIISRVIFTGLIFIFFACVESKLSQPDKLVNLSHLDYLYQDVSVGDNTFGIIRIYSNYPDYQYVWEKHEGIACVDDAARAAVVYLNDYQNTRNDLSLFKCTQLIRCLLYMQADNGYFYNFILEDFSINKPYHRSYPEPNWWSWRAIWAMTEVLPVVEKTNPDLAARINQSLEKSRNSILRDRITDRNSFSHKGFQLPGWLILKSAADQTAVLIMALCEYPDIKNDSSLSEYLLALASGLAQMQAGNENQLPYGAFLSRNNIWHGWGNLQAYALLTASEKLNNISLRDAALQEINGFYSYLLKENFFAEINFINRGSSIEISDMKKFPQIAYVIRPMVYACIQAYEINGQKEYLEKASQIAAWLFGANPAGKPMYNPHTGLCFDGIESEEKINLNSGAESTIEALLTLQMIEKHSGAHEILRKYIQTRIN